MRTSLAGRSGLAGLTRALLLALALGACGGGDTDGGGGATTGDTAASVAQASVAAADTCTTPPPAFSVALLNGRPWSELIDSLNAAGVQFPDTTGNDSILAVKLCKSPGCTPVRMAIRSSSFTPCLKPGDLTGSRPRIMGEYVLQEPFNPPAGSGWHPIPQDSSVFVFVHASGAPATMVYAHNGQTRMGPAGGWQFWYCQDGDSAAHKIPQAQWRPRGTPPSGSTGPANPPKGGAGQVEEEEDTGSYGWMACASGCCQFYTPPPNELQLPDEASEVAAEVTIRVPPPFWCRQR
jgi:hypothetical protein